MSEIYPSSCREKKRAKTLIRHDKSNNKIRETHTFLGEIIEIIEMLRVSFSE